MFTLVRFFCCYKNVFCGGFRYNNNNSLSVRDAKRRGRGGSLPPPPLQITSAVATRRVTEPTTSYV